MQCLIFSEKKKGDRRENTPCMTHGSIAILFRASVAAGHKPMSFHRPDRPADDARAQRRQRRRFRSR